ncbi:MAG: Miniconductance mechanosensitive channel MscM precursor, partial [Planctomycetota bacterium]
MITRIAVVLLALRWFICVGAFAQGLTPLPTLPPNPWAKPPGGVPAANQGDSSGAGQRRSSIKAMLANRQNGVVQGPGESGQVPAGDKQDASGSEPPVPANQPNSANPASPANPANPANPDSAAISSEAVQAQLQQLQSATDLDPNLKSSLTLTYEATLAEIKKRFEEEKAIKEYTAALEAATVATADAKKRKEKPDFKSPYIEGSLTWSSPEYLQSLQLQIGALLQGATKNRTDTETTIAARDV